MKNNLEWIPLSEFYKNLPEDEAIPRDWKGDLKYGDSHYLQDWFPNYPDITSNIEMEEN